jgi:hypothetical protein
LIVAACSGDDDADAPIDAPDAASPRDGQANDGTTRDGSSNGADGSDPEEEAGSDGSVEDSGDANDDDSGSNDGGSDSGTKDAGPPKDAGSDAGPPKDAGSDAGPPKDAGTDASAPVCGDNKRNGTEVCDGADLGGATCATLIGAGSTGTPTCTNGCTRIDRSGCTPPSTTTWSTLNNASKWKTFDMTTLDAEAKGYAGAVFDGRYVYFAPFVQETKSNSRMVRYDTQGALDAAGSWKFFDASTVNASASGFWGAAFDGRYVYFVPQYTGTSFASHGTVLRYDTQKTFDTSGSWLTFDVSTLNANAKGFSAATFDGRYLYLAPAANDTAPHGYVARFDTQATFNSGSSWLLFNTGSLSTSAVGFSTATFDGRYVYFVPDENASGPHGNVVRYDTQLTFSQSGSWARFDLATNVHAGAVGFWGATFDGRYIYLVPRDGTYAARYDTKATFGAAASWTTFDVSIATGTATTFAGAMNDGRYIYFVPGPGSQRITRYDSTMTFGSAGSWSYFDTSSTGALGFNGATFDGRYLYLAPLIGSTATHGKVARFDAKTPGWLPVSWKSSFY